MARLIKRGDLWIINLEPAFGREIHKKRPGLVISANHLNQSTYHVVIVPTTSIVPTAMTPEMVHLGKIEGFDKDSVLLPVLIRSIDQDRLIKKVGRISRQKLLEVEEAVKLVLGITTE